MKATSRTHLAEYGAAVDQYRLALQTLIAATERLAESAGADRTEFGELGRLSLHMAIDQAVDDAELQYPEPGRLIARTSSYAELLAATRQNTERAG